MSWRVAKSLLKLRDQVNARAPNRDKSSDGTIGDASHQSRSSDHNPWVVDGGIGVVTAIDISNDPAHKVVSRDIAEAIRASKDSRVKYVISNRQIFSSETKSWEWRTYTGPNPHTAHVHISVKPLRIVYDNEMAWALPTGLGGQPPKPANKIADMVSLGDMAHKGEISERTKKIQFALKRAVPGTGALIIDGDFGQVTQAAVIAFQAAKGLQMDGIVGPITAAELDKYLAEPPPPQITPLPPRPPSEDWQSGKGSWYSQYEGVYRWKDLGDAPGSSALGVPDNAQGVSFYRGATLGHWYEIEYPNGKRSIEQQTDIGPAPWTGKKIDISAVAAERAGYSPYNFPTGAIIKWRSVETPTVVASMDPRKAAVVYRDARKLTA